MNTNARASHTWGRARAGAAARDVMHLAAAAHQFAGETTEPASIRI